MFLITSCFLQISFSRQESSSKPARTETTVLFLPDVWSVMPDAKEFSQIKTIYEHALMTKLNPELTKKELVKKKEQEVEEIKVSYNNLFFKIQ